MKYIFKILFLLITGLLSEPTYAEGGTCPDGYYPIGGQGTSGCAPMPDNNNYYRASPPSPPHLPAKWANRWGTIVIGWDSNKNGIFGKAFNALSKYTAETDAMNDCKSQGGGSTCYIAVTYSNQCAALAVATGDHGAGTARGPNLEDVKQDAIKACTRGGGKDCYVLYSACSTPLRIQ